MRAFEIMTEGVQTVSADLAADAAWETMRRKRIHHLVAMRGQESPACCRIATWVAHRVRPSAPAVRLPTS